MSHVTPGGSAADRNLLFGILTVQMDFVSRDALITAMNAWVLVKHRSLGEILVEQNALTSARRDLLEALVAEHIRQHGDDPARSLAALSSSASPAKEALQKVEDPDVQASLRQVPGTLNTGDDPFRTVGEPEGARIRFRILRPHAKGGLGEVFVAHDEELNRPVALKEIQARHAGNRDSRGRFLLEAEITGRLEHPGIVPVYGLGSYADGRPYYAMRFIEGQDLREAIERFHAAEKPGRDPGERRLAFRELLGRFVDVCNAVAFAHSRGVLHRDLKPGNVMLGKYGETLVVDWGLAKAAGRKDEATRAVADAIHPRSGSEVAPTQHGAAIGTPAYMSPEQAAGQLERLGPASDVYSLGGTLYTLLTGKPPVDAVDVGEMLRKVQLGEVVPPRQAKPGTPPALEAVCRKAMALRPEDRYDSALALAADVEHWLADEPVVAFRESALARLRRWGRRHRPWVASAAALLVTATIALGVGLLAVNEEKNRTLTALAAEKDARAAEQKAKETVQAKEKIANEREAETRAVLDFVEKKVFAAGRPKNQEGGMGYDVKLADALTAALPFVETAFTHQPLIEARLRMTLGYSFWCLGKAKIAADQFQAARTIYTEHLGPDDPDTLQSMNNLANSYDNLGRHADALKLREETLAVRKAKLGPDHPDTLSSMNNLAISYDAVGRHADAFEVFRETLAMRKAKLGPDHPETLNSMNNLAGSYDALGRHAEALKLIEETLAMRRAKLGPDHPDTLLSMYNIACCHSLWIPKASDHVKQADFAMEWLRKAVAAGFKNVDLIRQDSDLDALRDREDFKKLVAEVEAIAAKAKK